MTTPLRIGMLSTFPPTKCGLATFAAALSRGFMGAGHRVERFRVLDAIDAPASETSLAGVLLNGSSPSLRRTARLLSECDVAVIQHEFGIFGGRDGDEILDLLRDIESPVLTVLHTIPQQASGHQAEILVELCERSDVVVVMSEAARERLTRTYFPIDESRVLTIQHGASLPSRLVSRAPVATTGTRLLTWGLLGPGKGIENVIDAIALLHDLGQSVHYTVAGVTHPKVLARDGHRYRNALMAQAQERGVRHLVTFDERYRDVQELTDFAATFDIVVLPYDSVEQVTSGVLVDAIAAGAAVIATPFPHAVELLTDGPGLVVPRSDPRSMAVAIRTLTTEPERLAELRARARAMAPSLSWPAVAGEYADALSTALAQRTSR